MVSLAVFAISVTANCEPQSTLPAQWESPVSLISKLLTAFAGLMSWPS